MPSSPTENSSAAVAVVIPTKDRAQLLAQTLRSIAEQTLPADEVIVADDGSQDETAQVVREAGATHIFNPQGDWGPSGGRNAGLAAASAAFVSFIDSDDLLHPRALERLHSALLANPEAPFAFGNALMAEHHDASGWRPEWIMQPAASERTDLLRSLFVRNFVPSGGGLVRRALAAEVGGFNTRMAHTEDHAFWLSLARRGEPAYVPTIVCVYRRHGSNRSALKYYLAAAQTIDSMSEADDRLASALARRRGVRLCGIAIAAVQERDASDLRAATSHLLSEGPQRTRTLAVASACLLREVAAHLRKRRLGSDDELGPFEDEGAIRAWLATR